MLFALHLHIPSFSPLLCHHYLALGNLCLVMMIPSEVACSESSVEQDFSGGDPSRSVRGCSVLRRNL